ncbi:MAG: PQQ-dependent sugar dehydrogenase [Bacteroidetes bacterium]|nr:PQQ-dependent sugar dehydrogenase [Bacteroidota bacterium]
MKSNPILVMLFAVAMIQISDAQVFNRSELTTQVNTPWEITFGPDNYLWLTESGGRVIRVDPVTGNKQVVYTAPDYFNGSPLEQWPLCFQPNIGAGTLGLALHPDFSNASNSFIYFVYSYNHGTAQSPETKFKVKRLFWDASIQTAVNDSDLILNITTGYDHLGGRLLAIHQNGNDYLFLTVGDHGISETNSPTCYNPQSTNPNNFAQDPAAQNGKIHRFNIDGTIPFDNPIPGNSFYTRGHRNPQGLMYHSGLEIIYDVEHGDRTDDEINVLYKGMNYGWKDVRGYHDGNVPGESVYLSSYIPDPSIANDSLVSAFYSFCAGSPDTSSNYLDWCTVAPSDGIYYGSTGIPQWTNSLLVVTLKDGLSTDWEVFRFKLLPNGDLVPSMPGQPNPEAYFSVDQAMNGRLRDITFSNDGKKLYLINNGGTTDKITVYEYDSLQSSLSEQVFEITNLHFPNPVKNHLFFNKELPEDFISEFKLFDVTGKCILSTAKVPERIDMSHLRSGLYLVHIVDINGFSHNTKVMKQ